MHSGSSSNRRMSVSVHNQAHSAREMCRRAGRPDCPHRAAYIRALLRLVEPVGRDSSSSGRPAPMVTWCLTWRNVTDNNRTGESTTGRVPSVGALWRGAGDVSSAPGGGSWGAAVHAPCVPLAQSPPREGDAARREPEVPDEPVQRPDLDAAHEVIERLEWADGEQEDTPHKRWRDMSRRTALDRRSSGRRRLHPQRLRRRQEDDLDGHHGGRGRGDAGRRRLRLAAEAEVRPGQPRHDEPVLRADEVRRRGRVQDAGLQLPVDGLAEQQRQRDGQRVQQRDHGQGERHRGVPRRPQGVQRPDRQGAGRQDPGRRLQRRRGRPTTGSPTSARTSSSRASRWASTSCSSSRPATWRSSSPRRAR